MLNDCITPSDNRVIRPPTTAKRQRSLTAQASDAIQTPPAHPPTPPSLVIHLSVMPNQSASSSPNYHLACPGTVRHYMPSDPKVPRVLLAARCTSWNKSTVLHCTGPARPCEITRNTQPRAGRDAAHQVHQLQVCTGRNQHPCDTHVPVLRRQVQSAGAILQSQARSRRAV